MTQLYQLEFRDKERKPLILNDDQMKFINAKITNGTQVVFSHKGSTYSLPRTEIKGIYPYERNSSRRNEELLVVCEYGIPHRHLGRAGWETCECKEYYWAPPAAFKMIAKKTYLDKEVKDLTMMQKEVVRDYIFDYYTVGDDKKKESLQFRPKVGIFRN